MNGIERIFVDLDGPVLDGKKRHYFCYRSILERSGYVPIGIDEYWGKKRAQIDRKALLRLSGAEGIYADFLAAWLLLIESPGALVLDEVQDGAAECLHGWKEQRLELVLVTMRRSKQALEDQLKLLGLYPIFNTVVVCDPINGSKAGEVLKIYHDERLGEHSLWIGDTEADWEAAQALSCNIVLVANGLRCEDYLGTLKGALVVPSIDSIVLPHT
ncbi:MAG TPA: HAD hydrolase-like protein [Nitrospira sp.]|nr:HAD hydrolase-like protein [Nitrospira sp.]